MEEIKKPVGNKPNKNADISKVKMSPGILLVEMIEIKVAETNVKGTIFLPNMKKESADYQTYDQLFKEHPFQGVIKKIGPKTGSDDMIYEVDDIVLLRREMLLGDAVLIDGNVFAWMRQSDIICSNGNINYK